MQIPLQIVGVEDRKRLTLVGLFKYKRPAIVKFLIDTGSPISFLCPNDVLRLQINQRALNFDKNMTIGGGILNYAEIKDISLSFSGIDKVQKTFRLNSFSITSYKGSGGADISILGLDFFSDKKLVVDLPNGTAHIEA